MLSGHGTIEKSLASLGLCSCFLCGGILIKKERLTIRAEENQQAVRGTFAAECPEYRQLRIWRPTISCDNSVMCQLKVSFAKAGGIYSCLAAPIFSGNPS